MVRQLSWVETRRVAELQLQIKMIDGEIQGSASAQAIHDLRAMRQQAEAELNSIMPPSTETPPCRAS